MVVASVLLYCAAGVLLSAVDAIHPLNKNECIEWHNKYRTRHQAPDVKWSESLARDAQTWADYLGKNNLFQHDSSRNNQGENLYWSSGDSRESCRSATTAFYNEVKDYDYGNPVFSKKTGHFTQVVWVKSTQLGVAKAETPKGATILVFRYSPPGNYRGQFAENVKPPTTSTTPSPSPSPSPSAPTSNQTRPNGSSVSHEISFMHIMAFGIIFLVLVQTLI